MSRRILIDPVTRLEGHGCIDIRLDDAGNVARAFFQVPDFKGFEKFCEGRAAEELPTLTQKICGVCPTAHHIASVKTLDALFGAPPPPAARMIRELMHTAFIYEDHLLHLLYLGGPDLLVDRPTAAAGRNIFGALAVLGEDMGRQIIEARKQVRRLQGRISGSALYPVCGLPGGVSRPVDEAQRPAIIQIADLALAAARRLLALFEEKVLNAKRYRHLAKTEAYRLRTYYMGLVDEHNRVNFYDGVLRIVDPAGKEFSRVLADDYLEHFQERVDPGSYMKILYLKAVGWQGAADGAGSGIYRVGPLARLNVADGMATPLAQRAYEQFYDAAGGKPAHNTLYYHWARLVELLYAAERMQELAQHRELCGAEVRNLSLGTPVQGVGVCEAPRGTLLHHYQTDERAIVEKMNLLVATQNNAAAIRLSVEKAAKALIRNGNVSEARLNRVEMAYRAYDPCLACATH